MLEKNKIEAMKIVTNDELESLLSSKIERLILLGYWGSKPHLVSYDQSGFNNTYYGFLIGIRKTPFLSMTDLKTLIIEIFDNPVIKISNNNYFTVVAKFPNHPDNWTKIS